MPKQRVDVGDMKRKATAPRGASSANHRVMAIGTLVFARDIPAFAARGGLAWAIHFYERKPDGSCGPRINIARAMALGRLRPRAGATATATATATAAPRAQQHS